jgi:hypothetical protein
MSHCEYTVPNLTASGDGLYAARICNQPFIDWAWDIFDFDRDDWDEGFGWEAPCDISQPLARTFAAIWCLTYSAEDYRDEGDGRDILHWGGRYARSHIDELDGRCGPDDKSVVARTHSGGLFVDEWTQLYMPFFYQRSVPERAGTLVHESRHAGGRPHDAGNLDSSWEYNGAWRWHVCWLAWFASTGRRTSTAMQLLARQRANIILTTGFVNPPGFTV